MLFRESGPELAVKLPSLALDTLATVSSGAPGSWRSTVIGVEAALG
jgi:hypothetical protein